MNQRKRTLEELIRRCMEEHEAPPVNQFSPMQLMELVNAALVLQERIWLLYGFKFLGTFVVYGMTEDLEPSDAIQLARQLVNARDDEELFVEFYYMLQSCYIDRLEEGYE
jgi:hypothetical protein